MSKWANIDALKARIDEDVKEDRVLDGWAFSLSWLAPRQCDTLPSSPSDQC